LSLYLSLFDHIIATYMLHRSLPSGSLASALGQLLAGSASWVS